MVRIEQVMPKEFREHILSKGSVNSPQAPSKPTAKGDPFLGKPTQSLSFTRYFR